MSVRKYKLLCFINLFSKINYLVKANIKIRSDLCHIAVGVQIYSSILIVELLDKNDMRN